MGLEGRRSGETGRPWSLRDRLALLASGLFLGGTFALWHLALGLTSVATSTLLVNLAPGFVALDARLFFGRRFGAAFLSGMAMALGGAALLVAGGASGLGGGKRRATDWPRSPWRARRDALLPVARLWGENVLSASWQGWTVLAGVAVSSRTCSARAWSPTPPPGRPRRAAGRLLPGGPAAATDDRGGAGLCDRRRSLGHLAGGGRGDRAGRRGACEVRQPAG
jgi:drug/metabolite transporter (DMT)-like permease